MSYICHSACACSIGNTRLKNEDNFYFDGKYLKQRHIDLKRVITSQSCTDHLSIFAVFDGVGGAALGEVASFVAARQLKKLPYTFIDQLMPLQKYIRMSITQMNSAVLDAKKQHMAGQMGTTMAGIYLLRQHVYFCNLGDSRIYRLRNMHLQQVSVDHAESGNEHANHKRAITQHLGIDTQERILEAHIAKSRICPNDLYLLCSDGLSDMLNQNEIQEILLRSTNVKSCVQELLSTALAHGGHDNITAIVCRISNTYHTDDIL